MHAQSSNPETRLKLALLTNNGCEESFFIINMQIFMPLDQWQWVPF